MESHPLNMAHQQHRRAEAHVLNNRYDDAIECHQNAAELLLEAMKSTTSSVALESITLQHNYHLKQKDLMKIKKEQFERVKKAMDHLRSLGKEPVPIVPVNENTKLQVALYRTINDTNSLVQAFLKKNTNMAPINTTATKTDALGSKKEEKSQETISEELKMLNHHLNGLVDELVFQVEFARDENSILKDKLNYLEKERAKYLNLPSVQCDVLQRNFSHVNIGNEGQSKDHIKKNTNSEKATLE